MLVDDEVEIVIQVNGKVRAKLKIAKDATKVHHQLTSLHQMMAMVDK